MHQTGIMKRNVLIIEDNEACRDALAEITRRCEAAGAVFCAGSSAAAYRYALEETIHLFLVDIILEPENPGDISGLIFAEKIRGIERYKYTPIIFVTSLIDEKLIAYQKLYCSRDCEGIGTACRAGEGKRLRFLLLPQGWRHIRLGDGGDYLYRIFFQASAGVHDRADCGNGI